MWTKVYQWLKNRQNIAIRCLFCYGITSLKQPLCKLCVAVLPAIQRPCSRCGIEITALHATLCQQCISAPPLFDCCVVPFLYQYPLNHLLMQVKYQSRFELIEPAVLPLKQRLVSQYEQMQWPEVMIPVPMHPQRLRRRGFNQAVLIARSLQHQLPVTIPIELNALQKIKATEAQQSLSRKQRLRNLKQAYAAAIAVKWRHVAIVDDVVTTGATVNELSRLLRQQGVQRIDVWCIARTPL